MAKDDYYVIVYQILSYLYMQLKKGEAVDGDQLDWNKSKYFAINKDYWSYVIVNMMEEGLITGITLTDHWGQEYPIISGLDKARITPKGIEFLCDNSFMSRARKFLKSVKEITPFV